MAIKQFVPSEACLTCEGCCRFDLSTSPWRPKVGQQEPLANEGDHQGYVTTQPLGTRHQCRFFNADDFTCGVYDKRPFECELYPFVLSQEEGVIKCYVHLACPFVQDNLNSERYTRYVAYLKDWLASKSVHAWLESNHRLLHDYRHAQIELELVFTIHNA